MGEKNKLLSTYGFKKADYFIGAFLLLVSSVFLWLAMSSIGWRIYHDSPIMMYVAMLIDKFHRVPYREIYEMNMPGTLFIYYLIGRVTNYSDLGFRLVDLAILAGIVVSTFLWLRTISWKAAWGTAVSFGFIYLWFGPSNSLQRDYLLVALMSCALMVAIALPKVNKPLSLSITGFLSAAAFLIKPHAILSFGLILLLQIYQNKMNENKISVLKTIFWYGVGFLLPILAAVIYLWKSQALGSLVDIARNYFPLYSHLNGELTTIYGTERIKYNITNYFKFKSLWPLLIPAFLGCFVYLRQDNLQPKQRNLIYFIILSAFVGSIYPLLSGQFFLYHYFLFLYFIIALACLCLPLVLTNKRWVAIVPITTMILAFSFVTLTYAGNIEDQSYYDSMAFVDEVAEFLNQNLKPGETVQPLDWTTGVLNGMMRAQAPLATSFSCDFQFYHDFNDPYIQSIRQRFIAELEKSQPRYVLWVNPNYRVFVYGENTTTNFPELNEFLNKNYVSIQGNPAFVIMERKK